MRRFLALALRRALVESTPRQRRTLAADLVGPTFAILAGLATIAYAITTLVGRS